MGAIRGSGPEVREGRFLMIQACMPRGRRPPPPFDGSDLPLGESGSREGPPPIVPGPVLKMILAIVTPEH
jgi:hypothetical protein